MSSSIFKAIKGKRLLGDGIRIYGKPRAIETTRRN
jgi:hypothetical protein